jgi:putative chitinase
MAESFKFNFTLDQLKEIVPGNPYIDHWYKALCEILPDYDIDTPQRVAAFLAQCAHESGGFKAIKENLNYRPPTLRKLFAKYFPDDTIAEKYCSLPNKQEAIANRIYANRMGNGPESSGDGYRYCGRGLIQLTGKDNYTRYAASTEQTVEEASEHLTTFEGCVQSACWFWEANNLNQFADKGDILTMTKRINGGTIGLEDRIKHYNHACHVLGA